MKAWQMTDFSPVLNSPLHLLVAIVLTIMVTSTVIGPSKHRHSTLGDPNFVENYFKNSRLHFIGTWRNRYRNRFRSLSNGFTKSHLNVSASTQKTPIIHIDMDYFFVSVVIRSHPELNDKPVAVCHSDNPTLLQIILLEIMELR